jgi:hypothetical protein
MSSEMGNFMEISLLRREVDTTLLRQAQGVFDERRGEVLKND